jgi:hypothetical protein
MRSPLHSAAGADCTTAWGMRTVGERMREGGSARLVVRGARGVTDSSGYSEKSAKEFGLMGYQEDERRYVGYLERLQGPLRRLADGIRPCVAQMASLDCTCTPRQGKSTNLFLQIEDRVGLIGTIECER